MLSDFEIGQTVYVVERNPDGIPTVVGWYFFVGQIEHVAIVKYDKADTIYDKDDLLQSILLETSVEEETGLWAFPIKDCYADYEEAQRKIDVYHFTKGDVL